MNQTSHSENCWTREAVLEQFGNEARLGRILTDLQDGRIVEAYITRNFDARVYCVTWNGTGFVLTYRSTLFPRTLLGMPNN